MRCWDDWTVRPPLPPPPARNRISQAKLSWQFQLRGWEESVPPWHLSAAVGGHACGTARPHTHMAGVVSKPPTKAALHSAQLRSGAQVWCSRNGSSRMEVVLVDDTRATIKHRMLEVGGREQILS